MTQFLAIAAEYNIRNARKSRYSVQAPALAIIIFASAWVPQHSWFGDNFRRPHSLGEFA